MDLRSYDPTLTDQCTKFEEDILKDWNIYIIVYKIPQLWINNRRWCYYIHVEAQKETGSTTAPQVTALVNGKSHKIVIIVSVKVIQVWRDQGSAILIKYDYITDHKDTFFHLNLEMA